jgi:hypothetical protein
MEKAGISQVLWLEGSEIILASSYRKRTDYGVPSPASAYGPVVDCCEHGNKPSASIKTC